MRATPRSRRTVELTRVASSDSESEWLAFAHSRSARETIAELRHARKKKRLEPRKGSFGLPTSSVRLNLELSPEEHAVIERGFAKVRDEMAAGLDGARPDPKQALLYLMDRVLHERPAAAVASSAREDPSAESAHDRAPPSPYTVASVRCPDCHRAAVETSAGRVEVDAASLSQFAGSAERIDIDPERELPPGSVEAKSGGAGAATPAGPTSEVVVPEAVVRGAVVPEAERAPPNSDRLRRELRARAGGRCENPHCRRDTRGVGHGHHLVARSVGGATALWNEVHVCERCHGLIHAGTLEITGNRIEGLRWTPRAADLTREVRRALERARRVPEVRVVERGPSGTASDDSDSGRPESRRADAADSGRPETDLTEDPTVADAIAALRSLGYSDSEAGQRVQRTWRRLFEPDGARDGEDDGELDGVTVSAARLITESLRR